MDAFFQGIAAWPWYAWVAIIAILGGMVVRIVNHRRNPRP